MLTLTKQLNINTCEYESLLVEAFLFLNHFGQEPFWEPLPESFPGAPRRWSDAGVGIDILKGFGVFFGNP